MCNHAHPNKQDQAMMQAAIDISIEKMQAGFGGPFGAVIVKDGKIVSRGFNQVTTSNDPTAHAEVVAIREACKALDTFELSGCEIYTSCEPCPMCLSAIYWARLDRIWYGNTRQQAADIGFDDEFLYREVGTPIADRKIPTQQLLGEEAIKAFIAWDEKEDKILY
ncbi:MAG TPA: tRNA-specific adenosine deaminase [Gammaproteobacteria bacterium]|jgi:tRNA(Arg) A34 adenosine deaminase TadA|nr:tRNA-specific adenosine deaminase [Gammaproteobacteria bacterium]